MGTAEVQGVDARVEAVHRRTKGYGDGVMLTQSHAARFVVSREDP